MQYEEIRFWVADVPLSIGDSQLLRAEDDKGTSFFLVYTMVFCMVVTVKHSCIVAVASAGLLWDAARRQMCQIQSRCC